MLAGTDGAVTPGAEPATYTSDKVVSLEASLEMNRAWHRGAQGGCESTPAPRARDALAACCAMQGPPEVPTRIGGHLKRPVAECEGVNPALAR